MDVHKHASNAIGYRYTGKPLYSGGQGRVSDLPLMRLNPVSLQACFLA
jgi:hypothetical protein